MYPDKKHRDSQNGSRTFYSRAILEERGIPLRGTTSNPDSAHERSECMPNRGSSFWQETFSASFVRTGLGNLSERATRFELATFSLGSWHSTNWVTPALLIKIYYKKLVISSFFSKIPCFSLKLAFLPAIFVAGYRWITPAVMFAFDITFVAYLCFFLQRVPIMRP